MSTDPTNAAKKRTRTTRPFPACSFEDAAVLPQEIQRLAGGQARIRRLTLFEQLNRSPDSGLARQQIVNSNRYGLTQGSYKAEFLELTTKGALATNPDAPPRERTRARFELAIADIEPFNALYEALRANKLPAQQVMRDQLTTDNGHRLSDDLAKEAVELFILNAKHIGILRPVSGTERVLRSSMSSMSNLLALPCRLRARLPMVLPIWAARPPEHRRPATLSTHAST